MHKQIVAFLASESVFSSVSSSLDELVNIVGNYLSDANGLRILSFGLIIFAILLFLVVIAIVYVKSIVAFVKNENRPSEDDYDDSFDDDEDNDSDEGDALFEDSTEQRNRSIEERERERELEKELQKELEIAMAEKEMFAMAEMRRANEEEKKRKKEEQEEEEKSLSQAAATKKTEAVIDLDWAKGKSRKQEVLSSPLDSDLLSYKQAHKKLIDLTGLIIDMIGRGVDDLKIAQTVMFRTQGSYSEDDVLQLIESIKDFINLCIYGNFEKIAQYVSIPKEEDALYHLAQGDPSLALAMIEALMDYNIDRSNMVSASKKEDLFKDISNQASIFGTMASINDVRLATSAFEMAIELNPNNINAWSRLGDMFALAETNNKAIWAYQNVLNQADEDIYARQVANANKKMSQYLYDQGNSLQAAKLYNSSKQYYDALGINRQLDKQEMDIIEIIESRQSEDIKQTILTILQQKNSAVYNF